MNDDANPYLTIVPLDHVQLDALHSVSLARVAWRQRDPAAADQALGKLVEPPPAGPPEAVPTAGPASVRQGRIKDAIRDFYTDTLPNLQAKNASGRPNTTEP